MTARVVAPGVTVTLPVPTVEYLDAYRAGIRAAASFAGSWDAHIDCQYNFEDVILCKFNLQRGLPRRKRTRRRRIAKALKGGK